MSSISFMVLEISVWKQRVERYTNEENMEENYKTNEQILVM